MRKKIYGIIICVAVLGAAGFTGGFRARVTIEVVDEEGRPVPDATVGVTLHTDIGSLSGVSNSDGQYTAEGRTIGLLRYSAVRDDYYPTRGRFDLDRILPPGVRVRRRYPDYTHRVMIRPIVNPVPMYAYEMGGYMPGDGEEVGFDFLKAGWVAPHGRGEVADVLVRIKTYDPEQFGRHSGEISWRFPNPGDGMVRIPTESLHNKSRFKTPRTAPESGYIAEWSARRYVCPTEGRVSRGEPSGPLLGQTLYFIRIRTELNEEGEVIGALYGRIDIGGTNSGTGWTPAHLRMPSTIGFRYYINPDGTRNMEFDPERNLFRDNLPIQERTRFPSEP